jgi:hypothetical protein
MVDSKNSPNLLYKIMWAGKDNIIWNMKDESLVPLKSIAYNVLEDYIDYNDWRKKFSKSYNEWLVGDNSDIYDINFSLNKQIIELLPLLNQDLKKDKITIYFWFDVDRDLYENFQWEFCPLTKNKLTKLKNTHKNNLLISKDSYLVFPE